MCGITGIFNFDGKPVCPHGLRRFNDALSHRGPDGEGTHIDPEVPIGLGHRRLSILDLTAAGAQPMCSPDQNMFITYNGEVYNFLELRDELTSKGHLFRTRTDTEVILAAYREWGQACVDRFNGAWAFAIWDRVRRELFISRDRFGKKQLYFVHEPGRFFAFASESAAFGVLDRYGKAFDERNLALGISNVFYLEAVGETIYRGLRKLKPGHNLLVAADGRVSVRRWWETSQHRVDVPGSYPDRVSAFRELLIDACKLRLRSDIPIGIALSGGLDSSAVYGLIRQIGRAGTDSLRNLPSEWQTAYVATFPGTSMDERAYAEEVVRHTEGRLQVVRPREEDIIHRVISEVRAEDFIYLSPPVVHTIYAEMKRHGISVSLDGHGADELMFGYPKMFLEWLIRETDPVRAARLRQIYSDITGEESQAVERFVTGRQAAAPEGVLRGLYERKVPTSVKVAYRSWSHRLRRRTRYMRYHVHADRPCTRLPALEGDFSDIAYRQFHCDSMPTLLRNWDRASMRHGVEIRMPFLDYRVVRYLFSLPAEANIQGGFSKGLLRDAVKGLIPESIRLRKAKVGVNAPMAEWFNGPMRAFLSDAVGSRSFLDSDVWNGPLLKAEVQRLCQGRSWTVADGNRLWPFINAWILRYGG